ncbi:hypothetical protein BDU57DRAFT_6471 [Ampelomyces quisqualis]|uniref:Uncharacterized protein n=1 Tax=Ampelomyces quisqualis TaxID=50730 RepID=A0A6A5QWR1_AMPQU|nr:hypothetical protein BDU57DRAFT_6471 [Ampelomyces quisqualis]
MRRPLSSPLTIQPPSWRAARPPTPRRATFPLPNTTSSPSIVPAVPALSYWSPDTPSPFSPTTTHHTPLSPINPFLLPPRQILFRMASPLLPASPLSVFDAPISPGYAASPMGSMCVVDMGFSPLSMHASSSNGANRTFWIDVSPLSEHCGAAPLSPTFMGPRTPPVPARKGSSAIQCALEGMMNRKASVVSVLSMGQERMKMRIEFFQWLAVRRWEGMEGEKKSRWKSWTTVGWKMWAKKVLGTEDSGEGGKKGLKVLRDAVICI